jgi:hypothetical protein
VGAEGRQEKNASRQHQGLRQCEPVALKKLEDNNRLSVGNGVLEYGLGIVASKMM